MYEMVILTAGFGDFEFSRTFSILLLPDKKCGKIQIDIPIMSKKKVLGKFKFPKCKKHTIRKVKFLSKNSILTKPPNIFTNFSPNIFLTIFLVISKLLTAKKSKTTTFSRVFHPQKSTKSTIFSGNQS